MQYTIKKLREELLHDVFSVYEVFKNYFGEDKTDLQNVFDEDDLHIALRTFDVSTEFTEFEVPDSTKERVKEYYNTLKPFIIVWWPEVTVSNESNRSIVIYDLYAKIELTMDGRIPYENRGFQLNKATYTNMQYKGGYIHSHVPRLYEGNIPRFQNPCLGTGPINRTINTLKNESDEISWMLFCRELSLYVTVESLKGGPYIKMEEIHRGRLSNYYRNVFNFSNTSAVFKYPQMDSFNTQELLREFLKYYLDHCHLSFIYKNDRYDVASDCYDYLLDISNAFIEWVNANGTKPLVNELYNAQILRYVRISNRKFYEPNILPPSIERNLSTQVLLTFKGNPINLKIIPNDGTEPEVSTLLDYQVAMQIIFKILTIINYRYTNEYRDTTERAHQDSSSTYEAVCYL